MNKKISSLKDLTEKYLVREIFELIWPYEKLKLDIAALEKIESPPAVKIATFLFKSQLVEHELRNFIHFLDSILERETAVLPFKKVRSKRSSAKLNDSGLGQLKSELDSYSSESINKIKDKINLFKNERDIFTHKLFSQKDDVSILAEKSQNYQKYASECLELINKTKDEILTDLIQVKINNHAK